MRTRPGRKSYTIETTVGFESKCMSEVLKLENKSKNGFVTVFIYGPRKTAEDARIPNIRIGKVYVTFLFSSSCFANYRFA